MTVAVPLRAGVHSGVTSSLRPQQKHYQEALLLYVVAIFYYIRVLIALPKLFIINEGVV